MNKLPKEYQKIYKDFYLNYANANTFFRKLALLVERWNHKQVYKSYKNPESILEIGAGNLNHVKYERNFKYYDVVEPKDYLVKESNSVSKIRYYYKSIDNLPKEYIYDKILSIKVFGQIENIEKNLYQISKHLRNDGKFSIAIDAEGEFLWWIAWRLTTGIGFWLKYKLDYGVLRRFECRNSTKEIINALSKYFVIEKINSFPFNFKNGRLYINLVCRKLNLD